MPGLTSIRTSEGKIEIVNQLLLPHTTEFIEISTIEQAHDAIKSMKVRSRYTSSKLDFLICQLVDSWCPGYCFPSRPHHRVTPVARITGRPIARLLDVPSDTARTR